MTFTRFDTRLPSARAIALVVIGAALLAPISSRSETNGNRQPDAPAPDLRVEYVGSDKGFAVGGQSVGILCVIRNAGTVPLPENTARVRCYPLSGMDFMDGALWPTLPALAPNQAVAYRWRLALSDQVTPLVFSVLIDRVPPAGKSAPGPSVAQAADVPIPSRVVAVSIPRFPSTPHLLGLAVAGTAPRAAASRLSARVGNDRTMINVVAAQDHIPVISVAGKEANDWKIVATSLPCAQVRSAEEGQLPWWDSFRWSDSDAVETKDSASATLGGSVGPNWAAQIVLESRANTGVVYGKLRLTARKPMRLFGVQLPRLLASPPGGAPPVRMDGTAAILNPIPSALGDVDRIAGAHTGALTFGITWPEAPPLPGWRSSRMPAADEDHLPILGVEWAGDSKGETISAGATIEFPFRIFVFGPSDTVKDAVRFRIP